MTLPAGYSLDAPAQAPNQAPGSLPTGYTLDSATPAQAPAAPASDWQDRGQGFKTKPTTTHTGIPSFQREGDNAVWYGKEQGYTPDKSNFWNRNADIKQGDWFDAQGNRAGSMPKQPKQTALRQAGNKSLIPLVGDLLPSSQFNPTVGGAVTGLSNLVLGPLQFAEHSIDKLTGAKGPMMTDAPVNAIAGAFDKNISGEIAGEIAPFILSGGATSATKVPGLASRILATTPKLKTTYNIVKSALTGAVATPILTSEANYGTEDNYWDKKGEEAKLGAVGGAVLGTAVEALPPVFNATRAGARRLGLMKGETFEIPKPIELTGSDPAGLLKLTQDAAGGSVPDKLALQRLNVSSSLEYKIPLTEAQITQDPLALAKELKTKSTELGSGLKKFEVAQKEKMAEAITRSITDFPSSAHDAAWTAATRNGSQPINPQVWANYILRQNVSDVPHEVTLLARTIKLVDPAAIPKEGMGTTIVKHMIRKGVSTAFGGPAGLAADVGGEIGYQALKGLAARNPNLKSLAGTAGIKPPPSAAPIIPTVPPLPPGEPSYSPEIEGKLKIRNAPVIKKQSELEALPEGTTYRDSYGTLGIKIG